MKQITRWIAVIMAVLCLGAALTACQAEPSGNGAESEPFSQIIDGVKFTPGESASSIFATWRGEAPVISEKASCLGGVDGEDVTYAYSSFRIQSFRTGDSDPYGEIRWVILSDDALQTTKGIAIGAAAQAVKDAYGTPAEETAVLYRYVQGGTELRFTLRDGIVTGIAYTVAE